MLAPLILKISTLTRPCSSPNTFASKSQTSLTSSLANTSLQVWTIMDGFTLKSARVATACPKQASYCTFDLNLLMDPWKSRILHSSKQDYCRLGKNNNLSQLWHCLMLETSGDMFHHRFLNKSTVTQQNVILNSKYMSNFSNLEFQNQ
jgi:hypothetical protein